MKYARWEATIMTNKSGKLRNFLSIIKQEGSLYFLHLYQRSGYTIKPKNLMEELGDNKIISVESLTEAKKKIELKAGLNEGDLDWVQKY